MASMLTISMIHLF